LYLIRHGTTAWHKEGRMLGHREIPLDDAGLGQADAIAGALASTALGEVVTSPLVRAVQTAEVLARGRGFEVARDPRLGDLRIGPWEGKPAAEVVASTDYRRMLAAPDERGPGGESLREVQRRARAAIDQILADNPTGEAVAVITHGAVVRALVLDLLDAPLESFEELDVAPGSITAISFAGAAPRLRVVGWTPKLGGDSWPK
jgi:broad specificity phosphatase PhoE